MGIVGPLVTPLTFQPLFLLVYLHIRILAFMPILTHNQLIGLFEGLSDETRVRILNILLYHKKPLVQRDVEKTLNITQSKVTRHYTYLKQRNVVQHQRHNQYVYFSINPDLLPVIRYNLRATDSKVLKDDIDRFEELKPDLYLNKPLK